MRKLAKSVFLGSAMALVLSAAAPVSAQDLNSELLTLLKNHPRIQAAKKNKQASKHGIGEAAAGYLPTVAVNADTGMENIKNESVYSSGYDSGWNGRRKVAGVTVTQNLFDGFASTSAVNTARIAYASQGTAQEITQQDVIIEAIRAYINVMKQNKLVELSLAKERSIMEQLELEDERVKRGSGISTDVLEAKQRLQLAKDIRVAEQGELRIATAVYHQVFNHAPDLQSLSMPAPPLDLLPESLEDAVKLALKAHPRLESQSLEVERTREARTQIRSDYYPTVDLVGSMNYERDKNATAGTRKDYSLLVQANWNAFTGFSSVEGEMRTAYEYGAARDNLAFETRKVVETTRVSWQKLQTVNERISLLENAVNIAAEIYDDKKSQRDAGKETAVTVLDAETSLYDRRLDYVRATHDAQQYIFDVLYAVGRLSPDNIGLM